MERAALKQYLLQQGVWENEAKEVLSNFREDVEVNEEDATIVEIFDSAWSLGEDYLNKVVATLDHHVYAVLDLSELGEHLADACEEYMKLSDGRIIEFEL